MNINFETVDDGIDDVLGLGLGVVGVVEFDECEDLVRGVGFKRAGGYSKHVFFPFLCRGFLCCVFEYIKFLGGCLV